MKKAWPIADIKIQDKAIAIKSVCCWQTNIKKQDKTDESPKKIQLYIGIPYLIKRAISNKWEKNGLFNK